MKTFINRNTKRGRALPSLGDNRLTAVASKGFGNPDRLTQVFIDAELYLDATNVEADLDLMVAAASCSPGDWRAALEGIGDLAVRVKVASIVGRDWFGQRTSNGWPHLADCRVASASDLDADPEKVIVEKVVQSLVDIGYARHLAICRGKAG